MRFAIAVLLALAFATPASAARSWEFDGFRYDETTAPNPALVATSLSVARAYWGNIPECTQVGALTVSQTGPTPGGRRGGFIDGCTAWIVVGLNDDQFCHLVTHEVGHLLGQEHSDEPTAADPADVMSAGKFDTLQACKDAFPAPAPIVPAFAPVTSSAPVARKNARGRRASRRTDRKWCRRHVRKCLAKYPELALRSLPLDEFQAIHQSLK